MSQEFETRIDALLEQVEKPARYIGGEVGSVTKEDFTLRVALSYPDVYEIGTANQAMQILYSLINQHTGAWAQRVFCPWPDMSGLMREQGLPLFLLESWDPVRHVDLWGITLQYELTYSNILEMLDLAEVPVDREQRGEDDPLVFGGGPCASNPHPVTRFFDFFIIGDGEAVVPGVLELLSSDAADEMDRRQKLERLAQLDGVFVPAFPKTVRRAVVEDLSEVTMPVRPVIPTMHAVHDRATLEIARGCTRGCRFCMAGSWYRPVRERGATDICRAAGEVIDNTGYEEVSLSSLSATDYSGIHRVLKELAQARPGTVVSLPSLRVDPDSIRLLELISSRRGSITIAPEAGSQRLRDVINKQVSDEDIDDAVAEAFRIGCTTVKLYFMIGLPTETMEDIRGIIDIAVEARRIGRREARSKGRARINVSVSSFVPKAHTPFQWGGMNSRAEIGEKQAFLRENMPRKQIKLSLHDVEPSMVEGAIARGGDLTGQAIEAAWRAGARFDAWSERFDFVAWEKGFDAIGSNAEREATRSFSLEAGLPWDDIDSRVSREFLLDELARAERAEATPDCRWDECTLCGVCDEGIEMKLGNG